MLRKFWCLAFLQAVGRIGEEDRAALGDDEIVRAAEALAFILVCQRGEGAVFLQAGDAALVMTISPNCSLPSGSNGLGAVTVSGSATANVPTDVTSAGNVLNSLGGSTLFNTSQKASCSISTSLRPSRSGVCPRSS